jgi:PhnB protein
MTIQPYLFFEGRAEEAIEFYRTSLGAEVVMLSRMKDAPESGMPLPPGSGDKIMHASITIHGSSIMISDGMCSQDASFKGFSLSLTVADEAEARRLFTPLTEGGEVRMPLGPTFFSPCFGMAVDRFGVSWMVYVQPAG